ncbi:MAG: metallophosphatase [Saprospiraceae bacterium]|nr:metallophosphatase [Saprospiraceae bacterium]
MKNKRIIILVLFVICLAIVLILLSSRHKAVKLTILFTNDTHSRIEPFPDNDPFYPGLGGFAKRTALIKKIRSEEKNVLLFDAGDFSMGTPYYYLFKGEPEIKLMNEMKYDAATIGNHEFDNGLSELNKLVELASFNFVSSNYDFSQTILNEKIYKFKIFEVEKLKIGVFGLGVKLDGLVGKKSYGKTVCTDPLSRAIETSDYMKETLKCDLVICLSHLGYSYSNEMVSDLIIAKNSKNIDLIIGGHSHKFLDKPTYVSNNINNKILVVQSGFGGINLGRLDYYFLK